jgi:hypothetical protein
MIINPTFEEFMGDKKVFHPELKGQYKMLWKLYLVSWARVSYSTNTIKNKRIRPG